MPRTQLGPVADRHHRSPSCRGSYLHTSEIGYVDEADYLFVVGRNDSARADRLALLEQLIRRLPGVSDGPGT